ncbi:MAG: transglycosylase domain-containing protein [Clostridium sp.]|nr:transglycosylase domain-containing protein [Clostridium sp.]
MKKIWRLLKVMLSLCCCLGFLLAASLTWQGWQLYRQAVEARPLEQVLAEMRSAENYTALADLPRFYLNAVVAVEDQRFYKHGGIDVISIGRAVAKDLQAGALVEGGSTITQQLAKNLYFTQEKKFERKIAEVFVAWDLEQLCSKDEILELYVNDIYFGAGYYNIHDAAWGYFGKAPAELSQAESALLAGLPNAPSAYNPKTNPELAVQRQRQVLRRMGGCYMLTTEEAGGLVFIAQALTPEA